MKKIIRVKNIYLYNLNNAEFKNFMGRFFALIPTSAEEERPGELSVLGEGTNRSSNFVGIANEDKAQFSADMLILTDLINQSRTNDNTAMLISLDKRRDPLITFIITTASTGRNSPIPAYSAASVSLYNILKPYRGIQSTPSQQKTAKINGLLFDLEKEDNKPKNTTLHLDDVISELRNVNDEYEALSSERTNERATNIVGGSKEVRMRLVEMYEYMSTMIFAHSIATPSDDATIFIAQLNKLIDETRAAYNMRKGIAASNKNKEEGENEERPGEL